jgi:hypothetical protein
MPLSQCWLCLNHGDENAQKLHTFVLQNIASIGVDSMVEMLHQHLHEATGGAEGTSKEEIRKHIQGSHLLCPSLQMAHNLRSLLELRDTLKNMLITVDENGVELADVRNMAMYLRVISEIAQMYRTGEVAKMLFFVDEKATAGKG